MLRYAALAFLLSIISPGIFSSAAGNIGCLFSETLCNQETEWCYDDNAFGRCLPLYGNVREGDMHRYELGTTELHLLEKEMQRLFLLGYRWSHTYTQCVLQSLLRAVRNKSEFDVISCNTELDQDLEGALKAIEGEEMEHVDPRNLAIVRFTPSVVDPHSDYADELYYPPVAEMLPPFRGNKDKEKEGEGEGNKDNDEETEGEEEHHEDKNNEVHPPSKSIKDEERKPPLRDRVIHPESPKSPPLRQELNNAEDMESNSIKQEFPLPPPDLPMALYMDDEGDVPFDPDEVTDYGDDYDVGYHTPYGSPPNLSPIYKRTGFPASKQPIMGQRNIGDVDADAYEPSPLRKSYKMQDFIKMAQIINFMSRANGPRFGGLPRGTVFFPNSVGRNLNYDGRRLSGDESQGVFQENPVNPNFRERSMGTGYGRDNDKFSSYPPYENEFNNRRLPPVGSQIPELLPPSGSPFDDRDYPADSIHPPYVREYVEPYPRTTEKNIDDISGYTNNKNSNNNYGPSNQPSSFDNTVSRYEKTNDDTYESYERPSGDRNGYKWMLTDEMPNENLYQPLKEPPADFKSAYGDDRPSIPQVGFPADPYYGRPPYSAYVSNSYDYDYPDYDYRTRGDLPAPPNFHRDERYDVKKPGPFFKSNNDFAFDDLHGGEIDGSNYYSEEDYVLQNLDRPEQEALLVTKARQGQLLNKDGQEQTKDGKAQKSAQELDVIPDLLLTEERHVEAVSDDVRSRGKQGFPKAEQQVASKYAVEGKSRDNKSKGEGSPPMDSYVYMSISKSFTSRKEATQFIHIILRLIGLKPDDIQNLSIEKNQVMFQVRENNMGMTATRLAERIEELRPSIKEKFDTEITQTGVGTKSAISAVVFNSGKRQMLAVAAIICGVCAALVVAASVLFFLRRHARSKAKLQGLTAHDTEASKDYQELCRARMAGKGDGKEPLISGPGHAHPVGQTPSTHAPGQRISSLSKESDNGNNSPSSRSSTSSWSEEPVISNMDISTGHVVLSYMEDHLKNKDRLDEEWVALCAYEAEPCSCNLALKPENAQKNRYSDITPYDHNRVILNEHTNVSGSSYINASSITDHDPRNPAYIATQGPLAATAADFWQLVWEQGSVVIVMLTRLTENGQALCHRYWPEEGSELYHIYEVHLVSEHIWCDDYLVRSFYLKNVRTGETRTVTQFHFLSWPESGIPASTKALLEFRRKVNKSYRGRSCPIIVHCSDGIGRTGTYCLIDMVLNRMAKGAKEIDIAATLEHIRDQRPNMVKTKSQFEFVLMAVAEEVHAILKALPQ